MHAQQHRQTSSGSDGKDTRGDEVDRSGMTLELQTDALGPIPWHALNSARAAEQLASPDDGLSADEVGRRQERFGTNRLPEEQSPGLGQTFLRQFTNPLIYILLAAALASVFIGAVADALFIGAVLLLNAVIGTIQESKAESSAQALKSMMKVRSRVLRNGREQVVDAEELVPGDRVRLSAGDSVPADLRLLETEDLRADESLLTGESIPVEKEADASVDEEASVGERQTMLHAGTEVPDGRALGLVCRTGQATEVGKIARSLSGAGDTEPPLVIRLRALTHRIALVVLGAVALLVVVQLLRGAGLTEIFFFAVALSVSAIPAGLPVAITVALSIGRHRMAERNVIVRRLPAVEGLGTCTLIASDKTGTLTANELTVTRIALPGSARVRVEAGKDPEGDRLRPDDGGDGSKALDAETQAAVQRLASTGVLCNEAELRETDEGDLEAVGDTVDVAFLVLGQRLGLTRAQLLERQPEQARVPFTSKRRLAATFNQGDEGLQAHVKGAAEAVLPLCTDAKDLQAEVDDLSGRGFRVLALATGPVEGDADDAAHRLEAGELGGLQLLGLVGLIDPLRQEVPEAVRRCHQAGVGVRMITGDHPATGLSIARQLGIAGERDAAVTGTEVRSLVDAASQADQAEAADSGHEARERGLRLGRAPVFARVEPDQKTAIVGALQDQGHYVAVTGDGVNDAPALRKANIGVAMGRAGTDVARRAADLILTDDHFASIVNGIEQGRIAYANVRKVVWLLISTGAAEIVLFFLAFALNMPLPLGAVQLLWLNLVTNGIQDVALAFEKGEPGVLKRPPRPTDQPIFDRRMIEQTLVSGLYMGLVAFGVFYWLLQVWGWSEYDARNSLLLLMVLFENVHIFNCRSEERSAFRIPLQANLLLIGTVIAAQGVHILAMYLPGLSDVLEVGPVPLWEWGALLGIALSLLVVIELFKLLRRWREGSDRSNGQVAEA
ncbi:MAG: HAD-IC family P-type ATPase [Lamprobacter sp.]|uniref:cation-translocating P-type ATPase n=1 Tax=Lamprobacter sp. TaxID=3100796 RepID=UPI002B25969C|nr:HAD-IC family P-type ATPase [Lamprobacter sp.]MEA3641219.1 HAD-IC family P-type ATPase [Lamprobacter sp.]